MALRKRHEGCPYLASGASVRVVGQADPTSAFLVMKTKRCAAQMKTKRDAAQKDNHAAFFALRLQSERTSFRAARGSPTTRMR